MNDDQTAPAPAPASAPDLKNEVLDAVRFLAAGGDSAKGKSATSDLSIDESLVLHSVGWEAVEVVFGSSIASVPYGAWNWGTGEIGAASSAYAIAFDGAASRLRSGCERVGGHGVVGVHVETEIERHHIDVELVGTAVRPVEKKQPVGVFASDLSGRDFALLVQAGWMPLGLAFGASFVYAPRRGAGAVARQAGQNVELTNFTEAMYSARETAMARLQQAAVVMGASGIVDVTVAEGPMAFAHHSIGFEAWGTAIKLTGDAHRHMHPRMVVELDDRVLSFQARSLR